MSHLYRARLALVAAAVVSLLVVAFEFPFRELVHQHGQLAAVSSELASVAARNAALSADVASLHSDSTVAAIAHEDYGLVRPGQRAFAVLPMPGSRSAVETAVSIPPADFVESDPPPPGLPATPAGPGRPSLVHAALDRLAFWRWAF